MITVAQAEQLISDFLSIKNKKFSKRHSSFPATEGVALKQSLGRTLGELIKADRDAPAFNKSLLDGVAIRWSDYRQGVKNYKIISTLPAGHKPVQRVRPGEGVEIMTGAAIPDDCDAVVPVEQLQVINRRAILAKDSAVTQYQGIRKRGADHRRGAVLLTAGRLINPPEIAILASVGTTQVKVVKMPRVAIISTGDELKSLSVKLTPFQTRVSNSYALEAALHKFGFHATQIFHFKDDLKLQTNRFKVLLKQFDVLVLTGGVSMGQFDFVPKALQAAGVRKLFHKVAQRPGKPIWVGHKGKQVVFGLPGNPVSTLVCAYRYVLTALNAWCGQPISRSVELRLNQGYRNSSDLTHFLPIKINLLSSEPYITLAQKYGGSGDFAALGHSDGFAEFSAKKNFATGSRVPVYLW